MKKIFKLLSVALLGFNCIAIAQTTTFLYTGGLQTWTVPVGVSSISVDIKGATGGSAYYSSAGGCGGRVQCTMAVTPGQVLNVYVGGRGNDGSYFGGGTGGNTGPFISGGSGGSSYYGSGAGGGGGATDIRIGGTALANRVLAAGGGGGGGNDCGFDDGGNGGGAGTAANGLDCGAYSAFSCGAGASMVAGGAGAFGGGGTGIPLVGGGGSGYYFSSGGGGGGGYFGGGGGYTGGGGGGSSFADPVLTTAVIHTQGANCSGDGSAAITVLCTTPVPGAIVGPATVCQGATATYTNPTGTPGGTWSSSNPLVATVGSSTGIVNGITPGVITLAWSITLPCGTATTSTTVTVNPAPSAILGPTAVCAAGGVITLTDATPGGTWSSSNPAVGTVDAFGNVTGIVAGTTTISYTVAGCSSTLLITVNNAPAPIAGPSVVCRFLTATLTDATPGGVWTSNFPAAVSVGSSTGIITGVGPGGSAAIISYTVGGCSVSQFVSVSNPPLPVTGPSQVCQSSAIILSEFVAGGVWSSSDTFEATVAPGAYPSGIVTGISGGVVTIAYTTTGCPPATHVVTVNPLPAPITGPTAICSGLSTTLVDTTAGGTWGSSDPHIMITPGGVVTSDTTGTTGTITYTLPTGCFVFTTVYTNVPPAPIVGLDSICKGSSTTLTDATSGGVWSSTNLAIAQVIDSSGIVNGITAGSVNISYTLPTGCFAFKPFIVENPVPASVTISGGPSFLCAGTPVTFTANAVNGGVPTFVWELFSGPIIPPVTGNTYTYTPIHGDVISVFMTTHGVCVINDNVADSFVLNVYPNNVSPVVNIMTLTPHDTIAYLGEIYTFYSDVIWGGTAPSYQWYVNNKPQLGATSSSFSVAVDTSDTVYCKVSGNAPCQLVPPGPGISNAIIIHGDDKLSVSPVSLTSGKLSLFPNPNNGSFTLSGSLNTTSNNDVYLEVSNMLGQVVYSGKTTPQNGMIQQQINMEGVAPGSYLLRVNADTGSETFHFVIGK